MRDAVCPTIYSLLRAEFCKESSIFVLYVSSDSLSGIKTLDIFIFEAIGFIKKIPQPYEYNRLGVLFCGIYLLFITAALSRRYA